MDTGVWARTGGPVGFLSCRQYGLSMTGSYYIDVKRRQKEVDWFPATPLPIIRGYACTFFHDMKPLSRKN